jgi:hypothetical protein
MLRIARFKKLVELCGQVVRPYRHRQYEQHRRQPPFYYPHLFIPVTLHAADSTRARNSSRQKIALLFSAIPAIAFHAPDYADNSKFSLSEEACLTNWMQHYSSAPKR